MTRRLAAVGTVVLSATLVAAQPSWHPAVGDGTAYILSTGNGPLSRIYQTNDAGGTWTLQFQNDDPRAFADADRGIAISDSVDGQFVLLVTANAGVTWARVPAERLPPRARSRTWTSPASVRRPAAAGTSSPCRDETGRSTRTRRSTCRTGSG